MYTIENKKRFKNLTLEKLSHRSEEYGIKHTKLQSLILNTDNKLDRILNDSTITENKKLLLAKKVFLKDGKDTTNELMNVISQYKRALRDTEAQFETNRLRRAPLSSDQKALLPLILEQYKTNGELSDNDDYNKGLLFLADNGLLDSKIIKQIDARTPNSIRKTASSLQSDIKLIDNAGVSYADNIEFYQNNKQIEDIERNIYIDDTSTDN